MNEPDICDWCGCEDHLIEIQIPNTNDVLYLCPECFEDYEDYHD